MSHLFKALFILTIFFGGTGSLLAQTAVQAPNIFVHGLYVQEAKVREGAVVKGAFRLENKDDRTYSGIKYALILSRYNQNGMPVESLDDKIIGPVTLGPKESKLISFSYTLPQGIVGEDLGIRIRAIAESGLKLTWDDRQFQVLGDAASSVSFVKSALVINGVEHNVDLGPTAYPGDTASYTATISNPGTTAVTLIPTVAFYKKDISGKFVTKTTAPAIKIAAKNQGQFIFSLPLNFDADVYVGKVTFVDEQGAARVPLTTFRYIVGGDIVTFHGVTSDVNAAAMGQVVTLSIDYTGTPVDISSTSTQRTVGSALLAVKLFNEKNELIGTAQETSEFSYSGQKNLSVKTTAAAESLRAVIAVTKDGRTIGSSNVVLSLSSETAQPKTMSMFDIMMVVLGFGIALVLFIIWKIRKNNIPPPQVATLAALLLAFASLAIFPSTTEAFTTTGPGTASQNENSTIFGPEYGNNVDWRPTVVLQLTTESRGSQTTLGLGEKFYVDGDVTINACQNKPSKVGYVIKYLDNGTWKNMGTTSRDTVNSRVEGTYDYTDNLRCGFGDDAQCVTAASGDDPGDFFIAPTTPGTYKIYMAVFNDPLINRQRYPSRGSAAFIPVNNDADKWIDNEVNFGWIMGYQEFTVVDMNPKGDVQIQSVTNGNPAMPYDTHTPRYLSRFWNNDGGTAVYLKSPSVEPSSALFRDLPVGGGYTTSLDANYPTGKTAPSYVTLDISKNDAGGIFTVFSSGIKKLLPFIQRPVLAAEPLGTPASCSRTIPTNVEVGTCIYARGGAECTPTLYERLSLRGLPSDATCNADLYYAPGGFAVEANKVTKVVYRFGQNAFNYSLAASGVTLPRGGSIDNPITVTKGNSATTDETVSMAVTSVSAGITAEWVSGSSCLPNTVCSKDLKVTAAPTTAPGNGYSITVTGTSISGVVNTVTFPVIIAEPGDLVVSCKATVNIPGGGVEDPASQAGINQNVTWSALVSGGSGPYTYTWKGTNLDAAGVMTSGNQLIKSYGQIGKKTVTLVVTDRNGQISDPQTCSVQGVIVKVNPVWGEN